MSYMTCPTLYSLMSVSLSSSHADLPFLPWTCQRFLSFTLCIWQSFPEYCSTHPNFWLVGSRFHYLSPIRIPHPPPKLSVNQTAHLPVCNMSSNFIFSLHLPLPAIFWFICLLGSPVGCEFYENRHHFCLVITLFPTPKQGHIGSQF